MSHLAGFVLTDLKSVDSLRGLFFCYVSDYSITHFPSVVFFAFGACTSTAAYIMISLEYLITMRAGDANFWHNVLLDVYYIVGRMY